MEDMSQFKRLAQDVAGRSVDTIFTDQVVFGTISRSGEGQRRVRLRRRKPIFCTRNCSPPSARATACTSKP